MSERTCETCGATIAGVTARRRFCSAACKKRAKRIREHRSETVSGTVEGRSGTRTGTPAPTPTDKPPLADLFPGARMVYVGKDEQGNPMWAPTYSPW